MSHWKLDELLAMWGCRQTIPGLEINDLHLDSRQVGSGDVFIALAGAQSHGMCYANQAAAQGAVAVIYDPEQALPDLIDNPWQLPVLAVPGVATRLGELASQFYGAPSEDMTVVGVTGTNGKTSTAHFIAQSWQRHAGHAGMIGTIGAGPIQSLVESERTTPDALSLQRCFAGLSSQQIELVAMEVSSHALSQGRCDTVQFDIGVFTNLSRDHLDYHGDMASYAAAKRQLFSDFGLRFAVINGDDPTGRQWIKDFSSDLQVLSYGFDGDDLDVRGKVLRTDSEGLHFELRTPWGEATIASPLLGPFNIMNLMAAAAVMGIQGVPFPRLTSQLELMQPVPGRMVRLGGETGHPLVVVDYAHTPDALQQVLQSLRSHCAGRLICVFGCGGDRDQGKRPQMGAIAEQLADRVIVTNDNPRGEDAGAIIDQVITGMSDSGRCHVEPDRAQAIRWAIAGAGAEDLVLIAGKGHENYQEQGNGIVPFNDEVEARLALGVAA